MPVEAKRCLGGAVDSFGITPGSAESGFDGGLHALQEIGKKEDAAAQDTNGHQRAAGIFLGFFGPNVDRAGQRIQSLIDDGARVKFVEVGWERTFHLFSLPQDSGRA